MYYACEKGIFTYSLVVNKLNTSAMNIQVILMMVVLYALMFLREVDDELVDPGCSC